MQTDNPVEVLFLTGQPGAGKTAVAKELSDLLWRIHEPHAVIDLDELCRGVLPTPTTNFNRDLAVLNLKAVWANFYAVGVRRLILSRIIQSSDDLDHFASAVPNAHMIVCLLQAPAATIQQRIIQRDPGSNQEFLLSATTKIAAQLALLHLPGFQIDNSQRPLNEVAREVLAQADWPCPLT